MNRNEKKILIVNAAYSLRAEIRKLLEASGFHDIRESGDGLEAVKLLDDQAYDLVITDIDIQNMDAWRLTRLIRSSMLATKAETDIIVLSSTYSERIAEATSKEFEVNRFIPLDRLHELPGEIDELFANEKNKLPKSKLLVIEDYKDTAELINRILHKRFDISFADNGESGLSAWQKNKHDIVLLDLMLPGMSGETVLKEILKQKPNQSVVMMTAHGDAKKAAELIVAGAVDFIAKPFKAEQLRHVCGIAAHREDFVVSNEQFKEKQLALAAEQSRAEITLRSIADGVITTDAQGRIEYINPVAESILGYSNVDVCNRALNEIYSTYHEASHIPTADLVKRAIVENTVQRSATKTVLKDRHNQEHLIEQEASPIKNQHGQAVGAVLIFRDHTEVKNIEKKLSFHTSHDPLTGLHNRDVFDQEVRLAIHESETSDAEHALCHISLSQFNIVNVSCGHTAGDKLLQKVANILKQKVRAPSDAIARIGGDEFGILLRHCSIEAAERICEVIAAEFSNTKFEHSGKFFDINAGIGIVSVTGSTSELSDLVSGAAAACNMAKERGKNRVASFSGEDLAIIEKRTEVLFANDLMAAIQTDRVKLYQQRIFNPSGKDSVEILIRVCDDDGTIMPPGPYLSAAERYNLTPNLDRWVIENTLQRLHDNPSITADFDYVSINLSGLSICDDTFTDFIVQSFCNTSVDPASICFEITETAAISNFVRAGDFITAIRDLGCKFALDDFGSGMSSFAYLKNLAVDILKIDGMFIKDILSSPIDFAMVKSINDVGHVMGLKTVAEYVENEEIYNVLRSLDIDAFQGYEIAKPEPLENLLGLTSPLVHRKKTG
jgi:diguanylate cyclase (GGDEF)-like protein/PAS domain S-box-containing protein